MFAYTMNVLLPEALLLVAIDKFDINQEAVSEIQDLPEAAWILYNMSYRQRKYCMPMYSRSLLRIARMIVPVILCHPTPLSFVLIPNKQITCNLAYS